MTDDSEVAQIAEGLDDIGHERRALLSGLWRGAIAARLQAKGLLVRDVGRGYRLLPAYRLTPLGLRVKAYLQSKGGDA